MTIANTISGAIPPTGDGDAALITWILLTADPAGAAVAYEDYQDRAVQATGTFGGATLQWEGSLDGGTTWFILTNPQGTAIAFTAAGGSQISEASALIRPRLTTVGAGATINAILYAGRSRA